MIKKIEGLKLHSKDTGSSEIQIALLTDKIEILSKHIDKFKKDKHSSAASAALGSAKKLGGLFKKK